MTTFRVSKRPPLEKGTVYCPVCASVRDEPCREEGPRGWRFRQRIHAERRARQDP